MAAITREELKKCNGTNGSPAYVAYKGKVYNLASSAMWESGDHFGHAAGQDLTKELGDAPHGDEVFESMEVVGELVD